MFLKGKEGPVLCISAWRDVGKEMSITRTVGSIAGDGQRSEGEGVVFVKDHVKVSRKEL